LAVVFVGSLCLSSLGLAALCFAEDRAFFVQRGSGYGMETTFQVALGDLDGDGDLDAVFANQGIYDSRVLLNDGTGLFEYTDQRLTRQGHGVGIGDLDGDGDLDLFITCAHYNDRGRPSKVYLNDGAGRFVDSGQDLGDTEISGNYVQLFDFDGDGDVDAYVAYLSVPGMDFFGRLYLNDGTGRFADSRLDLPSWATWADLDLDGDADAFVQEDSIGHRVLIQGDDGALSETWQFPLPGVVPSWADAVFFDADGDGDVDILDTNGSWTAVGPTVLLRNAGDGTYVLDEAPLPDMRVAWILPEDFDGDGNLDLFLSLIADNDQLWLGDGEGGFVDSGVRLGNADSRGAAAGDLDGDGDLDVFVPIYGMAGGPNVVWENTTFP
jgi:hypothetical protein